MAERPVGSAATLDDLRRAAAGVSGRTPEAFREWFERAGIPRLRITFRTAPAGSGGYRADVRIDQPGLVFHLPVDLAFYGRDGGERRETVELTGDTTAVYYLMDFEPLRLEVDPLGRLFQHAPERLGG
jgi:aminopeptidase N